MRNDAFDARNSFDAPPLPKPSLRQNDFGGSLGAAIRSRDTQGSRLLFFSYKGLRLLLPEKATGNFYTAAARANVAPAYQPLLAALPLPDGPANPDGVTAPLTVAYSDPTSFDSYSLRIDYNVNSRMTLFGRLGYSPFTESTNFFSELGNSSVDVDSLTQPAISDRRSPLRSTHASTAVLTPHRSRPHVHHYLSQATVVNLARSSIIRVSMNFNGHFSPMPKHLGGIPDDAQQEEKCGH